MTSQVKIDYFAVGAPIAPDQQDIPDPAYVDKIHQQFMVGL
jgi:hypothetical protein